MHNINKITAAIILTGLLSACERGGSGSGSGSNNNDNNSYTPSHTGTLTKSGNWYGQESYLQLGQDAPMAQGECNDCSHQNFIYTWQVDMDDDGVFDGDADVEYSQPSYAPNRLEYAKTVRLIATHDEIKEPLINVYHPTEMVKEIFSNEAGKTFAALKTDDSAVVWGNENYGGDTSLNGSDKLKNVRTIHAANYAMAVVKHDGSVEAWGPTRNGGDASLVQDKLNNITNIYSNAYSMVALNSDGGVVAWGDPNLYSDEYSDYPGFGGKIPNEKAELLKNGVVSITPTYYGAYAALKEDGTVVTWGDDLYGAKTLEEDSALPKITSLYSTRYAFSAIDINGNVIAWGNSNYGGDITYNNSKTPANVVNIISTNNSYNNYGAFAALTEEGEVIAWGYEDNEPALTNIKQLFSSGRAMIALDGDGNATAWGFSAFGGDSGSLDLTNINDIYSSSNSFVAVKNDGSLVHWGWADAYPDDTKNIPMPVGLKNVETITTNAEALVALKQDGTLAVWGYDGRSDKTDQNQYGNNGAIADNVDDQLYNIAHVYASYSAFAAVSLDGRVVTWGKSDAGGDSDAVQDFLLAKAETEEKIAQ